MADPKKADDCDVGLIGLGVMGSNFARNLMEKGYSVAGYNRDIERIRSLASQSSSDHTFCPAYDIAALCGLLRRPRTVILLVPAGEPVDAVIAALAPVLSPGDLIIDSGNSHFTDTDRRGAAMADKGLLYIGMGMSGGAEGARHGPSLMPGGSREGYRRVEAMLKAVAAQVQDTPCVAWLGPGSAGHYVKMVHNGIEYGVMQLIAETYDLMKRGLGMAPDDLHRIYDQWRQGRLNSYLMEITAAIFQRKDDRTGRPLIDLILDNAEQKGTGAWTMADALQIQVPAFNIAAAVMMRHLSNRTDERRDAAHMFREPEPLFAGNRDNFLQHIENALYAAVIITYAQGLDLLKVASQHYGYHLDMAAIARVWRGGCIIRAALLEDILAAYASDPEPVHLLTARFARQVLTETHTDLRSTVGAGIEMGVPVPGLGMALAYLDAYRSDRLPSNLIMAQRDFFGSHTYQRVDAQGAFHTPWEQNL